MKYAVIRIQGRQYKVAKGDEILVDKLGDKKPEADLLLVAGAKGTKIGAPMVKGVKVVLKVLGEEKGKKLYVQKFKAKSRYRKKIGFRTQKTRLQVVRVS